MPGLYHVRWLAAGLLVLSAASTAADHPALVKQYCAGCHNSKAKTANLSLENSDLTKVAEDSATWEKVLRKLNANEMPPAGAPRPPAAAQKAFTTFLESELDRAAAARPNPGTPTIHRLNRNEYSNAIRDLLALDIKAGANLPVDDTGYGFDNIGDVLSLSPVLIERYMSAARNVARLAVGNTAIQPTVDTFDALYEIRNARTGSRVGRNERFSEDLPFDSVGGLSFKYTFPVDGDYVFKIKMAGSTSVFTETAPPVGDIFEVSAPVKAGVRHVGLTFMRSDAIDEIIPGAGRGGGGGGRGGGSPATAHLDLRVDGARLKLYDVPEGRRGREVADLSIAGPFNIKGPGGHVEAVQYAFELAPDIKAITETKAAVMHSAVSASIQSTTVAEICKVIQFLADNGADVAPADAAGRTPLTIARALPGTTVVELLTRLKQ